MSNYLFYESQVEEMAISEFKELGYEYQHGSNLAPDSLGAERESYSDVLLGNRVVSAMRRLNPGVPSEAIDEAYKSLFRLTELPVEEANAKFQRYLTDGIPVEYKKRDDWVGDYVKIVGFEESERHQNEFLVANQFTIIQKGNNKRPDLVVFINGIPIVLFELKNPSDENATILMAYEQIQTYKAAIQALFVYNEVCVISDGLDAKIGSLTAQYSRYSTWKTKDGENYSSNYEDQLSTLIAGLMKQDVLLDYIENFVAIEATQTKNGERLITKKIAAYHQYYAVNKAVRRTLDAVGDEGGRKAGVVWHTQGSGKSLTMVFYAAKVVRLLDNPTILVINDRNDLDDQLFGTFALNESLLRQAPVHAQSGDELKSFLKVASGGIVFSTIQKFSPDKESSKYECLSERNNIVVIADEAHRSQYGFDAKLHFGDDASAGKVSYGFAKYMRDALPNATFIGFTGTPVEKDDANTPAVFGNYIDIYDFSQAIEDKVTVPIYYESRLAKVELTEEGRRLVEAFDDELVSEDAEQEARRAKGRWAKLEAIVGSPDRIARVAADIVSHFEDRQSTFTGKAMVVAMSRDIAARLYDAIVAIRPEWQSEDLESGAIKVVMTTASSDGPSLQRFHTTKEERKALASRMKDEADPLRMVIVRDMWLTGFDVPCLNTMYVDKPMREHNLMQAIARVNRVFKDKPGGLIVDYIGIAGSLKRALSFYADSGGKGVPAETHEKAVDILREKLDVVRSILSGFDYSSFYQLDTKDQLSMILKCEDYILGLEDGKNRYVNEVTLLSRAYALAKPDAFAAECAKEIAFLQAVKTRLIKLGGASQKTKDGKDYDTVVRDIVYGSLSSEGVIDIYAAAGLEKPELSVLSNEFLEKARRLEYKNVAYELLKSLIAGEIKSRSGSNRIQQKSLMDMLQGVVNRYNNNLITTSQVIDELIDVAVVVRNASNRGEKLGLSNDELAFYDALASSESAKEIMGDETLCFIAKELTEKVRANATIDWTIKESARARLMVLVRRTLRKYGYPPDQQAEAIQTVMSQAESFADEWAVV